MGKEGAYFVLEGMTGSGKTTQLGLLVPRFFKQFRRNILFTREPGGDFISEIIRGIVLKTPENQVNMRIKELYSHDDVLDVPRDYLDLALKTKSVPERNAYLMAASRAQSLRTVVLPGIENGFIVGSDRSSLTSEAYQGEAEGLGVKHVRRVNYKAVNGAIPCAYVIIDIDPELGMSRVHDISGDKFESKDLEFYKKVREGYKKIAADPEYQGLVHVIDGSGTREEVFERLTRVLDPILEERLNL